MRREGVRAVGDAPMTGLISFFKVVMRGRGRGRVMGRRGGFDPRSEFNALCTIFKNDKKGFET